MCLCIFSKRILTTMWMIYNQYILYKTEVQSKLRLSWQVHSLPLNTKQPHKHTEWQTVRALRHNICVWEPLNHLAQHLCTSAFRSPSNLNSINGPMQQPPDPCCPAADALVFPNAISGGCDLWICPLAAICAVCHLDEWTHRESNNLRLVGPWKLREKLFGVLLKSPVHRH